MILRPSPQTTSRPKAFASSLKNTCITAITFSLLAFTGAYAAPHADTHSNAAAKAARVKQLESSQSGLPEDWQLYKHRYPDISLTELKQAIKKGGVTLIDASRKDTYSRGHIPGALSLPVLIEKQNIHLPARKDTLIVAYCGGPKCPAWFKAADFAHQRGYKNIRHFEGGLKAWKSDNGDLATGTTP